MADRELRKFRVRVLQDHVRTYEQWFEVEASHQAEAQMLALNEAEDSTGGWSPVGDEEADGEPFVDEVKDLGPVGPGPVEGDAP